ncbi:MAG: hypothetical protein ABR980_11655 [Ignavibacteriaceae bacterium]
MIAHLKSNIAGNSSIFTDDLLKWIDDLNNFGIIIPIDKITMPLSIEDYLNKAHEFDMWVMEEIAYKINK